ncbi:hypothetical protein I4F81_009294 [Pyropia yezoensis]|uniref:Uncharacterized protein n=1 Tax=Pyropia yezoensis TaxID=2788 RepID=A0ACC3C919_PYRYE|nr:hypothetical protein I4F81_009294 [Neopyropia yezoensis]
MPPRRSPMERRWWRGWPWRPLTRRQRARSCQTSPPQRAVGQGWSLRCSPRAPMSRRCFVGCGGRWRGGAVGFSRGGTSGEARGGGGLLRDMRGTEGGGGGDVGRPAALTPAMGMTLPRRKSCGG